MPHRIGCKHCKGVSRSSLGKKSVPCKRGHRPHHQPWDDKQFELKCPNWKLWAYTDGSCIGKTENFINAGVHCPQTKADSGGVGMTNTINRAELTGIAAALTNKYTQIATDSACSRSQLRKQLLFVTPNRWQRRIV